MFRKPLQMAVRAQRRALSAGKSVKPLGDRVVVRRAAAETKTAGGILLPENPHSRLNRGTVVAVGPGAADGSGGRAAMSVAEGDEVLLPEYGGTTVTLGEDELLIIREEDILGKLQ